MKKTYCDGSSTRIWWRSVEGVDLADQLPEEVDVRLLLPSDVAPQPPGIHCRHRQGPAVERPPPFLFSDGNPVGTDHAIEDVDATHVRVVDGHQLRPVHHHVLFLHLAPSLGLTADLSLVLVAGEVDRFVVFPQHADLVVLEHSLRGSSLPLVSLLLPGPSSCRS